MNATSYRYREERPWGSFEILEDHPGHKVKKITVLPGKRLSLQRHRLRAEHWVVVEGRGVITIASRETEVKTDQSAYIPPDSAHRLANPGPEPLVIIEVQTGTYFGEDDIERMEDDFGRTEE